MHGPDDRCEELYRFSHDAARDMLRLGVHPDAIRAAVHLAAELADPSPFPELDAAKWRGINDALAGRPADP